MASEDLDLFVERCATNFLSDDHREVLSASQTLKQAHASKDETEFSRKAQEVAVFKGGSVLKVLLERVSDFLKTPGERTYSMLDEEISPQSDEKASLDTDGSGGDTLLIPSILGLLRLSASKVVVECLLKDASKAGMLASEFEYNISFGLETLFSEKGKDTVLPVFLLGVGLNGLVNFSRSSRVFREALRQLPGLARIFENLESICTNKVLGRLTDVARVRELKELVSSLMLSLSFSHDSQVWAIENGLLRVVAAIYESTPRRELSALLSESKIVERTKSPVYRCNMALVLLVESEAPREKLKQAKGLSLLKAHKSIINVVLPEIPLWAYLKAKVSKRGRTVSRPECGVVPNMSLLPDSSWRDTRNMACGFYPGQTVCSWKMCSAGPEPGEGPGFSKCARCQVARYCSKDHQKLHWRTHKKHCWAMPAIANVEEGRLEIGVHRNPDT